MAKKKKIGKGTIMDIDLDNDLGRISSSCMNGFPVSPPVEHTFSPSIEGTYNVDDEVLFIEKSSTEAENVILLPTEGGCL